MILKHNNHAEPTTKKYRRYLKKFGLVHTRVAEEAYLYDGIWWKTKASTYYWYWRPPSKDPLTLRYMGYKIVWH